jgi:hypothetical protein
VIGQAISFDGVDDYIGVSSFSVSEIGTITFWVKPDFESSWSSNAAIWRGNNYVYPVYAPRMIYYGGEWRIYDSNGINRKHVTIDWDVWAQYVIVWSTTEWKFYINGNLDYSEGVSFSMLNNNLLEFGRGYWSGHCSSGWCYYSGLIDEVRIYNTALNSAQIKSQYYVGLNKLLAKGLISQEEYQQKLNI